MVQLQELNDSNKKFLKEIQRDDIPKNFVEDVEDTIELSEYGESNNLKGHCYAILYNNIFVGIILIGEAIECSADPEAVKGSLFFRIMGFVIDQNFRGMGIGSEALEKAIHSIYSEFGPAPVVLECHKDNGEALKFYTRNGFRNTFILNNQDYYLIREQGKPGRR